MSLLGLFSRSHRRRQRARRRLTVTVVTLLGLGAMAVGATAYSRLYVFGETLSEVGNLLAAAGITSSPYTSPGFDNSSPPVWAEDIAAHLGLQANSWTSGGTNVDAGNVDGVLPDGFSLPSLAQQIQNYLSGAGPNGPDPNGVFVVQGGSAAVSAALAQLGGVTAVASGLPGPQFSSPLSFDNAPVIFGLPPGGQFVPGEPDPNCTENCPPPEPQFVCNEPCVPLPPTPDPNLPRLTCLENCDELPPGCLENCTNPPNTCIQNCNDNPLTPAIVAAPEPATIAVILAGLGGLVLVRQRRRVRRA